MISKDVLTHSADYASKFQTAKPFKFICIDEFFEVGAAENLLSDFPQFDRTKAINEFGEVGKKAVHTALKDISQFYAIAYDYLLSQQFLDEMSAITGIPDLLPDPRMYGGGTHENRHGQEMDPHVDFNYDQDHGYHRRLNLILYLNKGWDESWGGALELHSNPRSTSTDEVSTFNCIFNRAVIFETNEYSWHGFKRVDLPESEQQRSRKSLSIYLYTRTRPQEEIVPAHGTFYVPRPLPFPLYAGMVLTAQHVEEIELATRLRDNHIKFYQDLELNLSGQIAAQRNLIEGMKGAIRPNVRGGIIDGNTTGFHHDGWIASEASLNVKLDSAMTRGALRGYLPEWGVASTIILALNDLILESAITKAGAFEVGFEVPHDTTQIAMKIKTVHGAEKPETGDKRDLGFVILGLAFYVLGDTSAPTGPIPIWG